MIGARGGRLRGFPGVSARSVCRCPSAEHQRGHSGDSVCACVCAGEPAAQHEEGRHPDAQAQTQEHGRRARRRAPALLQPLRYVLLVIKQRAHVRIFINRMEGEFL